MCIKYRYLGAAAFVSVGTYFSLSKEFLNFLFERKGLNTFIKVAENYSSFRVTSKTLCHMVSMAFSVFKNTAVVDIVLKYKVMCLSHLH